MKAANERRTARPRVAPIRTCVGCRERAPAHELLRVVESAGVVVPDSAHRMPGRGAHLHRTRECLDLALRRRAFGRALRAPQADVTTLDILLRALLQSPEMRRGDISAGKG